MTASPPSQFNTPSAVVVEPDEGQSLWQPAPARGYVTVKLTPETMPYDTFSSGIQVLPPGCHVRNHGHTQNHELIFIYEGHGTCVIDGVQHVLKPETTILFGRYAQHRIDNTGETDMKLFWVFFPPGLENWFQAIGRPRIPGTAMPEAFVRPAATDAMAQMRFTSSPDSSGPS